MKRIILFLFFCFITNTSFGLPKDTIDFFEKNVRPVLVKNCYECHSSTSKKVKGGLLLDSKSNLIKGGKHGKVIVPGQPDQSPLIEAIKYNNKDVEMPPDGKLSDKDIQSLEQWVKMGAPDPRVDTKPSIKSESVDDHWSYQPIKTPLVPTISIKWSENPIDAFIYSNLEKSGLSPSYRADKRTLIRRAYYDLIGLPPTDQQVTSFINNTNENSYSLLIDELLNSPRYGERYGRHWLDTARYSDTTGTVNVNQEPRYTYSYTYRDYVIRSFNEDKPFNQFIIEQIAGDKIKGLPKKDLAALGYLTLGKNSGNVNDVIDDRIDVVTKGFMASTVVCARCHDHKFDPITTKDYYSLHGIFNSSYVPTDYNKPIIEDIVITPEYKDYLAKQYQLEKEVEKFINDRYTSAVLDFTTNTAKTLYGGYLLSNVAESNRVNYVRENTLNSRMIQRWGQSIKVNISVSKRQNLKGTSKNKASTINPVFYPYAKMFKVASTNFEQEYKRMINEDQEDINPYILTYMKKLIIHNMSDLSHAYQNAVLDSHKADTNSVGVLDFINTVFKNNGPLEFDKENFANFYSDNNKTMKYNNELRQERGKLITLELTHVATPPRAMVIVDKDTPSNSPILIKGDPNSRGPIVPRKFIEKFDFIDSHTFTNGSGRLELAKDIANDKNPLTARVIVNRIWMNHFGEGLVKTPDDFGMMTERPIQNQLLTYLASYLIDHTWSIKALNKLIMESSVYCQSSDNDPKKYSKDTGNSLYWRANINKLDLEELRDTVLSLAGNLNLKMGGQSVDMTESNRRTIYSLIDRGRMPEVFTTFDFATPEMTTGKRFQTTVPKQALFLMNNKFITSELNELIKDQHLDKFYSDQDKILFIYRLIYQRPPSQIEMKLAVNYISEGKQDDLKEKGKTIDVWNRFTQSLFLSNELVFIN